MSTPSTIEAGCSVVNDGSETKQRNGWRFRRSSKEDTGGGSRKGNATTRSNSKLLLPFRRRTESVNTLLLMSSSSSCADNNYIADDDQAAAAAEPNILEWLEDSCPADVLPVVLAFCGPQQTAALSKTNKHWNSLIRNEGTWRILCEELYKWKKGDPEPESWFDLYRHSPCVPVDYPTVSQALGIAMDARPRRPRSQQRNYQVRGVRILLRPGKYYLKQAVEIHAAPGAIVSMETMEMPKNVYRPPRLVDEVIMEQPLEPTMSTSSSPSKRVPSFRNLLSCNRQESPEDTEVEETEYADDWMDSYHSPLKTACLILRSRRHNEPAFRIRQGVLQLKNMEIQHNSHGLDIWNGNAAVQIQPPLGEDEHPIPVNPRPMALLERVQVTSKSGRGIVNIDGGKVIIRKCAVRDCAATGIYIGGPGTQAFIDQTDVIRNGVGNRSRRGIARGHSGIYLEQGAAKICNSNISGNTLTGISVVSPENAAANVEHCTLVGNGTHQLELPPPGTASRQRCVTNNNTMAQHGEARLRSGLTLTETTSSLTTTQPPLHPQFLGRD